MKKHTQTEFFFAALVFLLMARFFALSASGEGGSSIPVLQPSTQSVPSMQPYGSTTAGGTLDLNGLPGSGEAHATGKNVGAGGASTPDQIIAPYDPAINATADALDPLGTPAGHSGTGEVLTQTGKKLDSMVSTLTSGSNSKSKALIHRVYGGNIKLSAKNGFLRQWKNKLLATCKTAKKYLSGAASAINIVGPAATIIGHLSAGDARGAGYAALNEGGKKVAVWGGTSAGTAVGGPIGAVVGATAAEEGYNRTGGKYIDGLAQESETHATMISQYGRENYERYMPILQKKEEIFGQTGKTWQEKNKEWRTVFEKMKADLAAQRENTRTAAQSSRTAAQAVRTSGGSTCKPPRSSSPRPPRVRCDGKGSCRK